MEKMLFKLKKLIKGIATFFKVMCIFPFLFIRNIVKATHKWCDEIILLTIMTLMTPIIYVIMTLYIFTDWVQGVNDLPSVLAILFGSIVTGALFTMAIMLGIGVIIYILTTVCEILCSLLHVLNKISKGSMIEEAKTMKVRDLFK